MKTVSQLGTLFLCVIGIVVIPNLGLRAASMGTAFSYQGRLQDGGAAGRGEYDLRFSLYPTATGGAPVGPLVTNENVSVTDGLFTTTVDFGLNIFTGTEYWMELGVRAGGNTGSFTTLTPRQLLTPVPYALYAKEAGSVADGVINAAALQDGTAVRSINGLRDNFRIVGGEGVMVDTTGGAIVITALPPNCHTYSNCYWNLLGNGNLTPGLNFLGTVAGELAPLEFRVNNHRSLLHEFTGANTSPNLLGGFRGNTITGVGGTIAGGGQQTGINQVRANWGTVSGGFSNVVQLSSVAGTIGGGASNMIVGPLGTIAGGTGNIASNHSAVGGGRLNRTLADDAFIGGGQANIITAYPTIDLSIPSIFSAISGGISNAITGGEAGTIGGGRDNRLVGTGGRQVHHATIAGGEGNAVLSDSFSSHYSTIGGGLSNVIRTAGRATIGGGEGNKMFLEGHYATIGGGVGNSLDGAYGTISGGHSNRVAGPGNPDYAAIGGGRENAILSDSHFSTIAGGRLNRIQNFAGNSSIGGGSTNSIGGADFATIAGGGTNAIGDTADFSTIGGGRANTIANGATSSFIGGGTSNRVSGDNAMVTGGAGNQAQGNYSSAAGRRAIAQHNGSFVWADDSDADFSSTSTKQFAVRADNGVMVQATTRALDLRGNGAVRVAGAGIGTSGPAFVHRATAATIAGHVTTINHPHCNNDPNAILLVTQNWNPGGGLGVYNPHEVGVYYDGVHWAIFNEDFAAMPVNAAFNVLVIKP